MTTFPPFHLPFLFYHSHSTSLPFLSLFLALSSSSSPFSYKQQPISLYQFTNSHPNGEGQTLLFLFSHHIFHSLILWVFKTSRRRRRHLHHHHQPLFNITITIITLSSQLGLLVVKDSRCGFKIFMLFIRCFSTQPLNLCLFVACLSFVLVNMT